jgi:hypothetical protein
MPNVSSAMDGWKSPITLIRVAQTVGADGFVTDASTPFTFQGTIQPLSPKTIAIYPDELRAFKWLQIHSYSGPLNLNTNDLINYVDMYGVAKNYKVMGDKDYSLNGYVEYHVVEDYQP